MLRLTGSGDSAWNILRVGKNPSGGLSRTRGRNGRGSSCTKNSPNDLDVYCIRGVGRTYPQPQVGTSVLCRRTQTDSSAKTNKTAIHNPALAHPMLVIGTP